MIGLHLAVQWIGEVETVRGRDPGFGQSGRCAGALDEVATSFRRAEAGGAAAQVPTVRLLDWAAALVVLVLFEA